MKLKTVLIIAIIVAGTGLSIYGASKIYNEYLQLKKVEPIKEV